MQLIKINETTSGRKCIPVALVLSTDPTLPSTSYSPGATEIKVSKGGNGAFTNYGGTLYEFGGAGNGGGDYYYEPSAGELDTLGVLRIRIAHSGILTFRASVLVTAFDPFTASAFTNRDVGIVDSGTAGAVLGNQSITKRVGGSDFVVGNYVALRSGIDGETHVITVGGATATVDPPWPGSLVGTTPSYETRIGPKQPLTFAPPVTLTATAQSDAVTAILAALKADSEWKTMLANVNGQWSVVEPSAYPGVVTLTLTDKTGSPPATRATLALNCLTRPSVLSRVST